MSDLGPEKGGGGRIAGGCQPVVILHKTNYEKSGIKKRGRFVCDHGPAPNHNESEQEVHYGSNRFYRCSLGASE